MEDVIDSEIQAMDAGLQRFAGISSSIAGLVFVAFCIWLIIRVINRRQRWAKRTLAITLCLPVLYVASIGPAAWLEHHGYFSDWWAHCIVTCLYYPVMWLQLNAPDAVSDGIRWYVSLWTN